MSLVFRLLRAIANLLEKEEQMSSAELAALTAAVNQCVAVMQAASAKIDALVAALEAASGGTSAADLVPLTDQLNAEIALLTPKTT